MSKEEIISLLRTTCRDFWNTPRSLSPDAFHQSFNGKWSAAQNFEHINKGLKPTAKYFSLPKDEIESRFGLSNHITDSAEMVINRYAEDLGKGSKSPERVTPGDTKESYEELVTLGNTFLESLVNHLQNWNEEELEKYNYPHTVLGNITPREMLYFLVAHIRHHQKAVEKIAVS